MTSSADHQGRGGGGAPWRALGWGALAALLLFPAVAMQFSDEVAWTASDFVFAGVVLIVPGLVVELTVRLIREPAYRAGVGAALLATVLLIWFTGAVGIIGSEDDPANLMFGAVLVVALLGSVLGRFQPGGMMRAMLAAAVAQAAVGIIALAARFGAPDPSWPWDVVGATGLFVALWLTSAGLFRMAALSRDAKARAA